MKKLILSLMLVVTSSLTVQAQIWQQSSQWHEPFDMYAGPTLGCVASNLTVYDGKTMFGPYVGGFIQTYFNNHFGMSLEFAYTRQGARDAWQTFSPEHEGGPYEYRLDYINTLYKLRYYPVKRFDTYVGLMTGVHINAKCTLDGVDTDIKNDLHRRSAHVIGGVGYELDNLNFEAYYGFPLQKLARTNRGYKAMRGAREHVVILTVGYRFKLY